MKQSPARRIPLLLVILLAGLCGGAAEVAWIAVYGAVTGAGGWEVAREITATVLPGAERGEFAPAAGLAIHMALAVALAAAFVGLLKLAAWPTRFTSIAAAAAAAAAAVWAVNFLVVLPEWNPRFVALLPLGVTLTSKLLFGLAMAVAIGGPRRAARTRAL